jgi:MFS family permease
MKKRWKDVALAALIFGMVLAIYLASGNAAPIDSKWSIYTAMSILREGNTDLDEYRPLIAEVNEPHPLETIDGHVYSVYPLGAPLIALPFVAVIDRLSEGALAASLPQRIPGELEMFIASVVVALTTALLFGIARLYVSRRAAVCLALIFALCTSAWSVASRALWQHAPSMLWLTLALYLILLARRRPALIQIAGVPLALAYIARPTNSVSVVLLSLYVLLTYRRYFIGYVLGAALIAAPFVAFNLSVYHAALSNYYRWFQDFSGSTLGEALIGQWISPSRGLLIFSPIVALSFYGIYLKVRQRTLDRLDQFLIAIIALHWLSISIWPIWWGGWTFGPRMFADMLPYLIYFMIPVFAAFAAWSPARRRVTAVAGCMLIGYSAFVHYRGANSWETLFEWNAQPSPIDLDPARVWEWRDVQFMRGFKYSLTGAPVDVVLAGVPLERLDLDTRLALRANDLRVRRIATPDALIAPPRDSWLIIADNQTLAPELAPVLQAVDPAARASTLYDHVPYQVYHFDLAEQILAHLDQTTQVAQVGPGVRPPPEQRRTVNLPAQFGAAAELLGYRLLVENTGTKLMTYWRAGEESGGLLRLFVHALGPDGSIVAQDDRLDAPSRDWRRGDLIVQINRLPYAEVTDVIWEVGLYNPESGERVPVVSDGHPIDQRLLLQPEAGP